MKKIAFFDTKEYDKKLFDEYNKNYGYEIYNLAKTNIIKMAKEYNICQI